MEDNNEECIAGLCLGLGLGLGSGHVPKKNKQKENKAVACLDLAFELCPKGEEAINVNLHHHHHEKVERISLERIHEYPNEKSTDSDNSNNNNRCRKKLRLSKEQSSMLENSFKQHSTLNPVFIHIRTRNPFSHFNLCIFLKPYVFVCMCRYIFHRANTNAITIFGKLILWKLI